MTEKGSALRFLDNRKPTWRRPDDPVVEEVIIPSLQVAERFDCMVGYFGGGALRELAAGLASYIVRSEAPLRLLVSPVISEEDQEAIRLGMSNVRGVLEDAMATAMDDEVALTSALAQHTQKCLAYLLAVNRLQMKVVLVKDAKFHLKEWIFGCAADVAVLSGSANFTGAAVTVNVERLNLHRSWRSVDAAAACHDTLLEFNSYWNNGKPHAVAIDLPTAVRERLLRGYETDTPPTGADFQRALEMEGLVDRNDLSFGLVPRWNEQSFRPPNDLVWETGTYSHQGQAVYAWEAAGRKGILAMATGAGKTITALLCAWRLHSELSRLLIVIAAPTRPLVDQWKSEAEAFRLRPYVVGRDSKQKRLQEVDARLTNLDHGVSTVEVLVVTQKFLSDEDFKEMLRRHRGPVLLIADEVHNFGSKQFLKDPPLQIDFRLGLSATPERQYDEEGTAGLIEYFGETVFEFGLREAIGVCLVPYDYFLHRVELTTMEMEKYQKLTDQIVRLLQRNGGVEGVEEEQRLQMLLNRRRLLLENAKNKLEVLADQLDLIGPSSIRHALFYATDKDPQQLVDINLLLDNRGIRYHQLTAGETGDAELVASTLESFRNGALQALTAKRVLDEGLNVPEISTAFILASNTSVRQWVQRRGRVLRTCKATGKEKATIHDFVVLPPFDELRDEVVQKMIASELKRCDEFASLALNRAASDGPRSVLFDIRMQYVIEES